MTAIIHTKTIKPSEATVKSGKEETMTDTESQSRSPYLDGLRDSFAGQFLAGMIASETQDEGLMSVYPTDQNHDRWRADNTAEAYAWADAMLAERNKRCPSPKPSESNAESTSEPQTPPP